MTASCGATHKMLAPHDHTGDMLSRFDHLAEGRVKCRKPGRRGEIRYGAQRLDWTWGLGSELTSCVLRSTV